MSKTVVITGATRGIGKGLAEGFLEAGCRVVICGRHESSTTSAVNDLAGRFGMDSVAGTPTDVSDFHAVENLWRTAVERFGHIDIWINNAGLGAQTAPLHERKPEEIQAIVRTNVIGLMNGCRVALAGMLEQGAGAIYNMEGLGSRGPDVPGTAIYAASKAAVTRFTRVLVKETAGSPVQVGTLSPGMVITELFTGPDLDAMSAGAKRMANILADRVETVTPYLVRRILANRKHGARIDWLTGGKIGWRFATAPFRKNRLFPVD